jgi:MFS family permease
MGGEAPGGGVFGAEHARRGRTGLAVGLLTSGLSLGILLGSLVATSINVAFSPAQIADGIWRVPFLLGGVFGLTAMFLRRWLNETPVFEDIQRRAAISRELPLSAVLRNHRAAIVTSMVSTYALMATIVVVILMSPSLLHQLFGLASRATQVANLAGSAGLCISTVAIGAAVDRFGLRRVAVPAFLLLILATYGLYIGASLIPFALTPLYFIAGLGAGAAVLTPILMVRIFPPEVRFTGVSFSYNIACAVVGGVTPILVSWLAHVNRFSPPHYLAVAALCGLAAILISPGRYVATAPLTEDVAA